MKNHEILQIVGTHQGLFQYKRLIFGAENTFADFQKIVATNIIHDINGVFNISDDIQQLRKAFDKLCEKGLKLNVVKLLLISWDIFNAQKNPSLDLRRWILFWIWSHLGSCYLSSFQILQLSLKADFD